MLKTEINQGTERRIYRVVTVVDDSHNQGDYRLRDMLLWFESNCTEFSKYVLIASSFTYVPHALHAEPKKGPGNLVHGCVKSNRKVIHVCVHQ